MINNKTKIFKTPPGSRGISPEREKNIKNATQRRKISPATTPIENKKNQTKTRSRGNSPVKSEDNFILNRSRGSESGSIERLDESSNSRRIITSYNQGEDNINVVVRVRPLSVKEMKNGDTFAIQFPGSGQILIENDLALKSSAHKRKLFSYNVVFEPAATQEDVLQYSGVKRLIEMAVEGFRCTAFCYGQTGSGKTHTLTGPPGLFDSKPAYYSDNHGLVFRSFLYLFKQLEEKPNMHFILKASFLEIYNEKVIDLLNPGSARKPLAVRWSKKARGFFVENLFTVDCEELDDLTAVLEEGMRNRSVGSHNMNDHSSRSHTILTVHISSEQPAENGVFISRTGKINFVDLAGSEMTKKTQSEGKTLEEANNINKSLMVLGYCISTLSDCKKKNNCHIPYRDSQLTKLLADSLAGNGVTLMIACISPAKSNLTETINTLRYAARAKKVKTKPVVLMDPREALIISLKREVNVLQSENEHLRSALHLQESPADLLTGRRRILSTPPHVDLDKLAELEGPELAELVRLYANENEALRKENAELFVSREILLRDQELVCRENERLLKKMGENKTTSSELGNSTNVWTNPIQNSKKIPEAIRKELERRQIGNGIALRRRHNSLDDIQAVEGSHPVRVKSSESDGNQENSRGRRFSVAQPVNDSRVTITTPVLPQRMEFSSKSRTSSANNLNDNKDTLEVQMPKIMNRNGHLFGSLISLKDD